LRKAYKGVKRPNWYIYVGFIVLVLVFPFFGFSSFIISQATYAGIYSIVVIGLALLMGYAGQISLGQAAFYGVGAYVSAVLSSELGWSPWVGLLFSIFVPGVIAYVVGNTMARLSGYYLAMATLAFGIIVSVLLIE